MTLLHPRPFSFELRRRLVPPGLALLSLGVSLFFALTHLVTDKQWLEASLLVLAVLFSFKSCLFWWMRQTMKTENRKFTHFGLSLIDFFTAIVIGDIFLVYLFMSGYIALIHGQTTAGFFTRVLGRSGLISATVFVLSTGVAVGYEILKAHGHITVHEDVEEEASNAPDRK